MESKKTLKRRAKKARRLERVYNENKKKRSSLLVVFGFFSIFLILSLYVSIRRNYFIKHDDFVTVKAIIVEKKMIPHKFSSWPQIVLKYTYNGKEYSSEHFIRRKDYVHTQVGDSLMIPLSVQHGIIDNSRVEILKGMIKLQ